MDFAKYLQETLGEHSCNQIEELILDDLFQVENGMLSQEQKSTLEKYTNLQHLDLSNLKLKSLKNMPKLPNLSVLELMGNEINGNDLNEIVSLYPVLYKINLRKNKIETYECLSVLAKMPEMQKVNIDMNPLTDKSDYSRDKVFQIIPQVIAVDNQNKDGEEIDSTIYEEEGLEGEEMDDEDKLFSEGSDNEGDEEEDEEEIDEEEEEDEDEEEEKPVKKSKKH